MSIVVDTKRQPKRFTAAHWVLLIAALLLYAAAYVVPVIGAPPLSGRQFIQGIPALIAAPDLSLFLLIGLLLSGLGWITALPKLKTASVYLSLAAIILFIVYFAFSLFNASSPAGYFKLSAGFYFLPLAAVCSLAFNFVGEYRSGVSLKSLAAFIAVLASVISGGLQFSAKYFELEQDKVKQEMAAAQQKLRLQEIELEKEAQRQQREQAEKALAAQQKIAEEQRLLLEQQREYAKEEAKRQDPLIGRARIFADEFIITVVFQNKRNYPFMLLTSDSIRQELADNFRAAYQEFILNEYGSQRDLITPALLNRHTDGTLHALQQTFYRAVDSERVSQNHFVVTVETRGISYGKIQNAVKEKILALQEEGKVNARNYIPRALQLEAEAFSKVSTADLLPLKQFRLNVYYDGEGFYLPQAGEVYDALIQP